MSKRLALAATSCFALFLASPLTQAADLKAWRAGLIEQNAQLCERIYVNEIKNSGTRKQFCSCVHTDYFTNTSDEQLLRMIQSLEDMEKGQIKKDTPESYAQAKRDADEDERRLAASEKVCMKKYGLSVKSGSELMLQGLGL
ncbi:MAG: hypothetical protein LBS40_00880 [Burkholderiales bacterium]|nr:hypothetical protein [Burkholderiales bacterium]